MQPKRYIHDCDTCIYLGQKDIYDLYFCPNEPTIVLRYGNEGHEYASGIVFAFSKSEKPYRYALELALQTPYKNDILDYLKKYESDRAKDFLLNY